MNASGMLNTCKSNEHCFVAIQDYVSGKRASNTYLICLWAENNHRDMANSQYSHQNENMMRKDLSLKEEGAAYQVVGKGNGLPSLWRVAGLRGCPAAMELRNGPYFYGRQQWGILDNGRKPDPAIPRGGLSPKGCKLLFWWKTIDGTPRIRDG